eukprot:m.142294 g.142294  ORF g.142294 m.142294 type:complete len:429 (+) comp14876_c0_seq1:80-1366(+)
MRTVRISWRFLGLCIAVLVTMSLLLSFRATNNKANELEEKTTQEVAERAVAQEPEEKTTQEVKEQADTQEPEEKTTKGPKNKELQEKLTRELQEKITKEFEELSQLSSLEEGQHRLAVLVPFRNVQKELESFVPHMHKYFTSRGIDFSLVVINQTDEWRFNRGQLLNVGAIATRGTHDYIAMHDVDLLPMNKELPYTIPEEQVALHLASPKLHPIYHYKEFIGGVMLLRHNDFYLINGLSNRFWGWGREDDELYWRLTKHNCVYGKEEEEKCSFAITRPEDIMTVTTGFNTFRHLHDEAERPRDYSRIGKQWKEGWKRDQWTGVRSSSQDIVGMETRHIRGFKYYTIMTNLHCDVEDTPWCQWYKECLPGFYRRKPEHKVCSVCTRKCWTGFVLYGHCTQTTSPICKKIGRDISVEEAQKWPKGTVRH